MTEDDAVQELLERVAGEWTQAGVLDVLCDLVRRVWRADLIRFEPDTMGDDAMSLGMQASRNLCNLAVKQLQNVPGVSARDRRTLEISYQGRLLHVSKAPSDSLNWDVHTLDWAESEVRESAATANTIAYQSRAGTLFEDWDALPGQGVDPEQLHHLHLTWQGFADGSTRTWLGFPQLGHQPWYAVMMIDDGAAAVSAGTSSLVVDLDQGGDPGVEVTRYVQIVQYDVDLLPHDGRAGPVQIIRDDDRQQGA